MEVQSVHHNNDVYGNDTVLWMRRRR